MHHLQEPVHLHNIYESLITLVIMYYMYYTSLLVHASSGPLMDTTFVTTFDYNFE